MKFCFTKPLLICLAVFLMAAGPAEKSLSLAPNFTIKDLDQIPVELASFKNKKPVVLFFWTTWCPYCLIALKNFNKSITEWDKEGIMVMPINSGESAAKVAKFAKSNGYTFRIFTDTDSAVSNDYHIYGIPIYFAVDKEGYVRSITNSFPQEEILKLAKE